jgi:hypothetical protein
VEGGWPAKRASGNTLGDDLGKSQIHLGFDLRPSCVPKQGVHQNGKIKKISERCKLANALKPLALEMDI